MNSLEKRIINQKENLCCYCTRADYGLLRYLIKLINRSDKFELQLVVTGTHLSKMYGATYKEIEADGLIISGKWF